MTIKKDISDLLSLPSHLRAHAERMGAAEKTAFLKYVRLCRENDVDPIEWENSTLQVGDEFLPAHARRVLKGGKASAAYWHWLADQLAKA